MNHGKMIGKTRLDYVAKENERKDVFVGSDEDMINVVVRAMKENEKNKLLIYRFAIGIKSGNKKYIHPT